MVTSKSPDFTDKISVNPLKCQQILKVTQIDRKNHLPLKMNYLHSNGVFTLTHLIPILLPILIRVPSEYIVISLESDTLSESESRSVNVHLVFIVLCINVETYC